MDMITLAMAKAYTDEKVASGGGSGGGVCLPVVELTSNFVSDQTPLNEEDSAAMDAVGVMPCVIKFVVDGEQTALVFAAGRNESGFCYTYQMNNIMISVSNQSGNWLFGMEQL